MSKELTVEVDDEMSSKKKRKMEQSSNQNFFQMASGMHQLLAVYQMQQNTANSSPKITTPAPTAGCSRRALLKQRKLCHFCHRKPASIVEQGVVDNEQLRFCSEACLKQFKLEIFTQETVACLQDALSPPPVPASSQSASPLPVTCTQATPPSASPEKSASEADFHTGSSSVVAKKSITRPRRKRRGTNPRPHPSYALNKRYWEEMKARKDTEVDRKSIIEASLLIDSRQQNNLEFPNQHGISPSSSSDKSAFSESPEDKIAVESEPDETASLKEELNTAEGTVNGTGVGGFPWFQGMIVVPFPIPCPIPIPFPVPDRLFEKVKRDLDLD